MSRCHFRLKTLCFILQLLYPRFSMHSTAASDGTHEHDCGHVIGLFSAIGLPCSQLYRQGQNKIGNYAMIKSHLDCEYQKSLKVCSVHASSRKSHSILLLVTSGCRLHASSFQARRMENFRMLESTRNCDRRFDSSSIRECKKLNMFIFLSNAGIELESQLWQML